MDDESGEEDSSNNTQQVLNKMQSGCETKYYQLE